MSDEKAPSCAPVAATLALGGNIGNVAAAFATALASLVADPHIEVTVCSSVYRTPPWGKSDQPRFLNMAVLLLTTLSADELLDLCLTIERRLGRERRERWGPRTLDLDLLTYGDVTMDEPGLTLPHPRLRERAFVLVPLAEIAPDLRIGGVLVAELLGRVDASGIEIDTAATRQIRAQGNSLSRRHDPNGRPT